MKPIYYMKFIIYTFTFFLYINQFFGQTKILQKAEIQKIFNADVKSKFKIDYKIFRVYSYNEVAKKSYVVLTEKVNQISNKDTLNHKIKAINFVDGSNGLEKQWEINDFVLKEKEESSIWFWTKYCDFNDIDKDGVIEPILVYGTSGINGYGDGRIKILLFYKGQKIAIRHQNGILDFERNTQVDQSFYSLDISIQNRVKEIMQKMMDNDHAIFPYGWQAAMKKKKLKFDEKH